MASEALRLYGTAEPVEPAHRLRAGPLALELHRGRLKRITCGAYEVWHGLAFVLRDPDWGTPEPDLQPPVLRSDVDGFECWQDGRWGDAVSFRLHARGTADGTLSLDVQAQVLADIAVNRLGLCLLHPLAACGARVEVRHVDGRTSASTFPITIPPWPPFMLVRGLRHEWAPGCRADAELQGDTFETEDQRNNGDASFKTYSRSNLAPRPYKLTAGTVLRQSALLRVEGAAPALPDESPCTVRVGEAVGSLPPVGIEIQAIDAELAALQDVLRELHPAHLHLAVRPHEAVHWDGVAAMLEAGGSRLRLDLPDASPASLADLQSRLRAAGVVPEAVAVFPAGAAAIDAARQVFGGAAVGTGTPHFFVQLSRLDTLGTPDFASFTTSAVVHGADDDEVMLGLASLPAMVETWRARHPLVPLRAGPNGIAARASPLGAQPQSDGTRRLALAAVDPRSRAQFGAAWALGHVAGFAAAGVDAITLLALTGPSGLVTLQRGRVQHHPAFAVLQALGGPAERLRCSVSHPARVAALALRHAGRTRLLLANLTPEPLAVRTDHGALHLDAFGVSLQG